MATNIKMAIPGKSIYSTDPRDFSLNLDYVLWKIFSQVYDYGLVSPVITTTSWAIAYDLNGSNQWYMSTTTGGSRGEFIASSDLGEVTGWQWVSKDFSNYFYTYYIMVDGVQN